MTQKNFSQVELFTTERVVADESGLVHGGFIFGLADYSAMMAVNHPNCGTWGADVKFLRPMKINETIIAHANVIFEKGKNLRLCVGIS